MTYLQRKVMRADRQPFAVQDYGSLPALFKFPVFSPPVLYYTAYAWVGVDDQAIAHARQLLNPRYVLLPEAPVNS